MIKFGHKQNKDSDQNKCSIKAAVDANLVALGQRYMIEGHPVTCVDIDNDKYIFSMDDIYKCASHDQIMSVLQQIYTTGKIDDIEILPISMMQDIDFLFVPSEYQISGEKTNMVLKKKM